MRKHSINLYVLASRTQFSRGCDYVPSGQPHRMRACFHRARAKALAALAAHWLLIFFRQMRKRGCVSADSAHEPRASIHLRDIFIF